MFLECFAVNQLPLERDLARDLAVQYVNLKPQTY